MRSRMIITLCAIAIVLGSIAANAAVPTSITVQGKLTDAGGVPLPSGAKTFTFRIFNDSVGGTQIWPAVGGEIQSLNSDPAGLWIGSVGAVNSLTSSVFADTVRWLEITVNGTTLPRVRLVTGPYAYRVATLDGATGGEISGMVTTTGDAEGLRIQGPGVGNANEAYLRFTDQAGTSTGYVGDAHPGNPDIYLLSSTGGLHLYTAAGEAVTARADGDVSMGMNGNVGVGVAPAFNIKLYASTASEHTAVGGQNDALGGLGVTGSASGGANAAGVYGFGASGAYAGYFFGNVEVTGTLTKDAGSFKIDHPLDPANKYLYHSFVESPDMMNIYNGNIVTDAKGNATVTMPDWFGALNRDFRYQLTVLGQFAQAIVLEKMKGNQFSIMTDKPNVEVSWQVTGIRQDAYANAHRIPVEEPKPNAERGFYRNPELFSQPEEKQIEWARRPDMMKEMKERREKSKVGSEK